MSSISEVWPLVLKYRWIPGSTVEMCIFANMKTAIGFFMKTWKLICFSSCVPLAAIFFILLTSVAEKISGQDIPSTDQVAQISIDTIADSTVKKKTFFKRTFKSIGEGFNKTSTELGVNANLKMAAYYEKNENYKKSIEYYEKAIITLKQLNEHEKANELEEHVAALLVKDGKLEEALVAYNELEEKAVSKEDTVAIQRIDDQMTLITQKIDSAILELEDTRELAQPNSSMPENAEDSAAFLKVQAQHAEELEDYEQSLYYYKEYIQLEQKLADEKQARELILLEKLNEIENRDREIIMLKQNEQINALQLEQSEAELKSQRTFKRNLAIGIILIAALSIALYFLYRNKRKDHKKLGVAYGELEQARDSLAVAERKIKGLLDQQVSGAVADELLSSRDEHKVERRFVCIMFLDIRDFTPFAEKRDPEDIIAYQNLVFGFMIDIVNKHKGVINQILGDGFMATFGAPVSGGNDCELAVLAAKEIIRMLEEKSRHGDIPETRIGIGLHAGYVVAGNVGTEDRKQYSITGNTVILASRIEQLNKEFKSSLVISREVYNELPDKLKLKVEFQQVNVKGRKEPMEVAVLD